jgi:hypothetical protein
MKVNKSLIYCYNKIVTARSITVICSLLISFILLVQIPDMFGNPDSIRQLFGISSTQLLVVVLIISIGVRIQKFQPIHSALYPVLIGFFPLALYNAITFTLFEYFTYPNFVYSVTRINFERIYYLAFALFVLILIGQSDSFFRKNYKKILLFTAPAILMFFFFISLWPFDRMYFLVKEDSPVEYLQFFILLIGSVGSCILAYTFTRERNRFLAVIFLILGVLLFFVAGDEISWGQRLLHIQTPEQLALANTQEELTFHNLRSLEGFVSIGYILIGLYGSVAHILKPYISHLFSYKLLHAITPPSYFMPYFLITVAFNCYILLGTHTIGRWAEITELLLYSGITLFICSQIIHKRTNAT